MRHLDTTSTKESTFSPPLIWTKVVALPLEAVGGRVEADPKEEGAHATIEADPEVEGVGAKAEAEVECLSLLPIFAYLYRGGGIGYNDSLLQIYVLEVEDPPLIVLLQLIIIMLQQLLLHDIPLDVQPP